MALSNNNSTHHNHGNHPITLVYKECTKNHAAHLGLCIFDGCGEYMPSSTTIINNVVSMRCAACHCHRNFHRCESSDPPISPVAHHALNNQPPHHNHPPPSPPHHNHPPSSPPHHTFASPLPISVYHPSLHIVRADDAGLSIMPEKTVAPTLALGPPHQSKKRFRTKFTLEQKVKMLEFAEKVGWKMPKLDKQMVKEFCNEVGVRKEVLKVWLHNNKNTFGKRDNVNGNNNVIGGSASNDATIN